MVPCRAASATMSRKNCRSTQCVVGLCGNEIRIIFGLREDVLYRCSRRLRNSAGVGIGSMHAWPSAMITPY